MPDPRELMMLAQQGGGGGPPQMPPGGGGDPRMAQAMQQKLAQLMQDPVARAGMQAHMQGGDPRQAGAQAAMQDPRMAAAMQQQGGGQPMPPNAQMQPGNEQDMVSSEINRKGATFDGNEAPTKNDIERLMSDPSPENIKAFDAQFGEGAAEQYLGEEGGETTDATKKEEPETDEGDYK